MILFKNVEEVFRKQMEKMLKSDFYKEAITTEIREVFEKYLSDEWIYFRTNEYQNDALELMSKSMASYQIVLSNAFFKAKKGLLEYQVQLLQNHD